MKKKILLSIAILGTLLLISGNVYYLNYIGQVEKLKTSYPVFDQIKKHYILVNKKPKNWIDVEKVPKIAKWALIVSEDWAFYDHSGIDEKQIIIAFKESIKKRRLVRGASTITQQVIKNSLLSNEKTINRKIKEILLAIELERVLSKDEILEIYINLVELGDNVYGIQAASQKYFQKNAYELNGKEGAFLAMLLPSPIKYAQSFHKEGLTPFAQEQVDNILIKLRQAKIITEEKRLELESYPLSFEVMTFVDIKLMNIENEVYESSDKGALLKALDLNTFSESVK
jgi:monofunctional biosynthetic peptidoglycan transglycosylase